MRSRRSVDSVGSALLAALGLLGACGGITNGTPVAATKGDSGGDGPTADAMAEGSAASCIRCANPSPVLVGGSDTGYDKCAQGHLRRRAVMDCPSLLPREDGGVTCVAGSGGADSCSSDLNCGATGFCARTFVCEAAPGYMPCGCSSGCVRDSDCPVGTVCLCGDPIGTCVPATCSSDLGCGAGCDCIESITATSYPLLSSIPYKASFGCQGPRDECAGPGDCAGVTPACVQQGDHLACVIVNHSCPFQ